MRTNATHKSLFLLVFSLLFTLCTYPACSQTLDRTFLPKFEKAAVVSAVVQLPDHSVLLAGDITNVGDMTMYHIVKMSEDGTIDPSFNFFTSLMGPVKHAAVQTDNKILIGGSFSVGGSSAHRSIMRLNPDGTIDPSFSSPLKFGDINRVVVQPDGKILISGNVSLDTSSPSLGLLRLNPDGSIDNTFDYSISIGGTTNDIILLPDGKIVAAGRFMSVHKLHDAVVRLNADGTPDPAFTTSFKLRDYEEITALALQASGQVLFTTKLVLPQTYYVDASLFYGLGKLNTDGSLDETFANPFKATGDKALTGELNTIALHGDKILVGGRITPSSNPLQQQQLLLQLHPDGTIDTDFNSPLQRNNTARSIHINKDNSLLVAGVIEQVQSHLYSGIIKLSERGDLVTGFAPDLRQTPMVGTMVDRIATQPDGKVIVLGSFGYVNGKRVRNAVRLTPDGKTDETFNSSYADATHEYIARFYKLALQGDKILTATSTLSNGTIADGIVRLHNDGTPDKTFTTTAIAPFYIKAIATQPDHKIVVGTFDGLMRLMPDGTIDHDFVPAAINLSNVTALAVQNNGKILVQGVFTTEEDLPVSGIVQLNSDGSVDTSFDAYGFKYNSQNYSSSAPALFDLTTAANGDIIVTGSYNAYKDNVVSKGLMRLKADGSFIGDIPVAYMFSGPLLAVASAPEGDLLLGGSFRIDNRTYSLIRLTEKPADQGVTHAPNSLANLYPNPTASKTEVNFTSPYKGYVELRLTDYLGKEMYRTKLMKEAEELHHTVDLTSIKDGLYFLSVISGESVETKRIVKTSNQ